MAASVKIHRVTGSTPSGTDITSGCTRASTSDNAAPGTANPIPIPSSGSNYSYWVNTQLSASVAPDNAINNIKWYTDGTISYGDGIGLTVVPASAYIQAVGTAGSSGCILVEGNHAGMACNAASDAFIYTSSCKLTVSGSIGAATGSFGHWVVMQVSVESGASTGNSAEESFTWEFDEL